jgi:NADH-quinone oxidoreductase subunit D
MSQGTSHLELQDHEKTFLDSNELIINMGPQHPATHGVLRVILKLDGEKVLGTECVIGYLHRGVEKMERTKNVGFISAADCVALGVTGPVLRASGVKWDLRKAQPYAAYSEFDFEIPIGTTGDTYDRYLVRMQEMRQSLRIIEQAVGRIPSGPIMAKVPKVIKPPAGEIYHSIEAPKGELGYFIVSDGSTQPYRIRVRPPSFVNLQALDQMVRGALVADVIAVIGTLDIVLGEVDR